jgi:multidrug resistance efflux pump
MARRRDPIVPGWLRSTATSPAPASNQPREFRGVLRTASSLVAAVLAILMLSAVVPPLVADQSDRAVVNAPVTLLTAPISGDVDAISIRPGEAVTRGQTIARLSNARVDRTTLITLESKAAETKGRLQAAGRKRDSNAQYLAVLDRSLQEQTRQSIAMFTQQIAELKARSAATASSGQEKKANLERQTSMVARNVASPEMMKPAQQQYATALHQGDAETAKLRKSRSSTA